MAKRKGDVLQRNGTGATKRQVSRNEEGCQQRSPQAEGTNVVRRQAREERLQPKKPAGKKSPGARKAAQRRTLIYIVRVLMVVIEEASICSPRVLFCNGSTETGATP